MTTPGLFWQGDQRWGGLVLGSGPGKCAGEGCVLTALTAASVRCAGRNLNPGSAILELVATPGAFIGDEIVVPTAAPALGLDAGPLVVGDDGIRALLKDALAQPASSALLRVDNTRLDTGARFSHTVLGVVDAGAIVECLDPACGDQDGVENGWCAIGFGDLMTASRMRWNGVVRTYKVAAARMLSKARAN